MYVVISIQNMLLQGILYTILPQITAWVFISSKWFLAQTTKWDSHLLVEDSCAVYNLWC